MNLKQRAEALGWTDVHGGPEEGGMFWRGINPLSPNRPPEEVPKSLMKLKLVEKSGSTWLLNEIENGPDIYHLVDKEKWSLQDQGAFWLISGNNAKIEVHGLDKSKALGILQYLNENL